jgi:hypothetical protein
MTPIHLLLWAGLTKLLGVKHEQTTAYHPQSKGMVERTIGLSDIGFTKTVGFPPLVIPQERFFCDMNVSSHRAGVRARRTSK